jgi:carbamoyl-phosphate synthase large subunit
VVVASVVDKVGEPTPGSGRADAVELITTGQVQLVINTPQGRGPRADGAYIRTTASVHQVPCLTTVAAARAAAAGIADWERHTLSVRSLQEFHEEGQLRLPV